MYITGSCLLQRGVSSAGEGWRERYCKARCPQECLETWVKSSSNYLCKNCAIFSHTCCFDLAYQTVNEAHVASFQCSIPPMLFSSIVFPGVCLKLGASCWLGNYLPLGNIEGQTCAPQLLLFHLRIWQPKHIWVFPNIDLPDHAHCTFRQDR